MSHWYDFGSVAPPPGLLVRLRRYPEDTPPYYGTFDFTTGEASTQVASGYTFRTPWPSLTHWATLTGTPPQWPIAVPPGTTWRDPLWSTPTDGQWCWLKRWHQHAAIVSGQWSTDLQGFKIRDTTWLLPWHFVWKWKPC